jgi:hypothetical protein
MADLNGKFAVVTFTEYLGLGYIFDKSVWNVFPIFADYFEAQKLWNNQVELIEERNFKMRFIEHQDGYKFMLYAEPLSQTEANFAFYRRLNLSKNYRAFKSGFKDQAVFRFGILDSESQPNYLSKFKIVSDVEFLNQENIHENSIEWIIEEAQRRMRAAYG